MTLILILQNGNKVKSQDSIQLQSPDKTGDICVNQEIFMNEQSSSVPTCSWENLNQTLHSGPDNHSSLLTTSKAS